MKEKSYFLNFIEEGILNPEYHGYIGGRVEVLDDSSPYPINELRFFTNKIEEFEQFRNANDFRDVNSQELGRLEVEIKLRFNNFPKEAR